jgi:C1A family cysteine protease
MNILQRFFSLFKKEEEVQSKKMNFGWTRDLPDHRDFKFKIEAPHALPPSVDLRNGCPPIYDQGDLGSCTANALGGAFQFEQKKQQEKDFIPSRLFIYYNERAIEGTIKSDAGAQIRDGIKTLADQGVCPEDIWPYKPSKFTKRPDPNCYKVASGHTIQQYLRITPHTLYEVKHCLSDGYPVAFGFTVYQSMMSEDVAMTGIVPMPDANESPMGGHAVLAVGYDDSKNALLVRNSWGTSWGIKGYFWLPYGFIENENMSADYWTIRMVE